MLVLQVIQGPDRGRRFELPDNEPQLIGRSSEALPLSDSTMSRRHAELTPDDGAWWLRDLQSSNGTFINGQPVTQPVHLRPGDQVRCGATLFMLSRVDEPKSHNPVRMIPPDAFDTTFERTTGEGANDESMILASPDPVRAAMNHLRVVYELTEITSETLGRDDLLGRVMDLIFSEFRPDRGFILLTTEDPRRPEPAVVRYRQRPRTLEEGDIPVSRTIIEHTLEKQEGILSTNAMNDSRFRSGDSVQDYGIRSAICVPILSRGGPLGVIHIDSQLANFTFTEDQLQLLSAIGRHTGLAIATTQLFQREVRNERLVAVGEAVASLSHSIKNILQGLRGGADAVELALGRDDLALAKQGWPILGRNLDRIYALTMNMLTYSRPPALDVEMSSLPSLVEEIAELVQAQCDRKQVALVLDVAPDLPPVPFDANAMHQAIMNVITNAIDAVAPRSGVITVALTWDARREIACVRVSDNGPGIPAIVRARAFEPFVSTKGQRGTGLGLAVARKIIVEHKGAIELHSSEESGTTVAIELPADRAGLDSGETLQPRPMPSWQVDDEFDEPAGA